MKVSCNQSSLAKQLGIIGRLVNSRPGLPILANVLLETEDSKLKLTATDLEMGVHTWIGAEVKEDGVITIPAKTFSEFVNTLPSEKVDLILDKQVLKVDTKNNSAQFNTLPSDDFPKVPTVADGKLLFSVDPAVISDAINKVSVASASDDSRPVLTGIKLEVEGKKLSMVSVDGFRLSRKFIDLDKESKEDLDLLIPSRSMQELSRIISDLYEEGDGKKKDFVEVYLLKNKNQIVFRYKEVDLTSRLIDGQFPEYKQIIPTGYQTKVEMDSEEFRNSIRIVNIFARNVIGNKAIIEIDPEKNNVTVGAALVEVGENKSSFGGKIEGDKVKIGFSAKFLSDMLSTIDGDSMVMECSNSTAPGVFRSKDDESYLHIIMPMRID
jgi:DNA polymerase-3 subunit beta